MLINFAFKIPFSIFSSQMSVRIKVNGLAPAFVLRLIVLLCFSNWFTPPALGLRFFHNSKNRFTETELF